jgi:hypothetical protein
MNRSESKQGILGNTHERIQYGPISAIKERQGVVWAMPFNRLGPFIRVVALDFGSNQRQNFAAWSLDFTAKNH